MALELYGTHGTCAEKLDAIKAEGLRPGIGRHGTGVYLWSGKEPLSIELAEDYAKDNKSVKKVAVLLCSLQLEESNFMDLSSDFYSGLFRGFVAKFHNYLKTTNPVQMKKRASVVADNFVAFIEETYERKIEVVHTHTQAPESYRRCLSHAERFLGQDKQGCYVVINPDCIHSMDPV